MRDDQMIEVVQIMKKNPDISVKEVDEQLSKNGMSLGIIDKIQLFKSKKEEINITILSLATSQKQFDEFGYGEDQYQNIEKMKDAIKEIDAEIERLKKEYRRLFPKNEIFK